MGPRRIFILLLAVLVLFGGLSARPVQSAAGEQFFPETRHWVRGDFLDFWKSSPDPLLIFGYPITEAMPHPIRDGIQIQFFQRARLEYDSSRPPGKRVQLASLGEWMYDETQRGLAADFPVTNNNCRAFTTTQKNVCYAFLQFYDRNQGAKYFGQPISDAEYVNGRLIQYFDNARMEWRPELPAGQRVVLTDLGRLNFDLTIGDAKMLAPVNEANIPVSKLTQIQVYAFAARPLLGDGEQQELSVVVHDEFQKPLEGVQVMITVAYPDGRSENYRPDRTDAYGLTQSSFKVESVEPNQVIQVQVTAEIPNGPTGQAGTWFRIWW